MNRSTSHPASRWPVVLLAVGAGLFAAFQIGKVPPTIPVLREDLGISLVTAGWIISTFNVIGVVIGTLAGAMADSFGHRRLVLAGLLAVGAASGLGGLAPDAPVLLATRILEGFGFVVIVTAAPGLIVRAARDADVRLAFGLWGTYMPLGTAIMILAAPPLLEGLGWRGLWQVNAALMLLYALVFALATRDLASHPARAEGARRSVLSDMTTTFTAPGPLVLAFCFATYTGNFIGIMGFLPTFLVEELGYSHAAASVFTAFAIGSNMIGNLVAGWLLHRGVRRYVLILAASATMAAAGLLLYADGVPALLRLPLFFVFSAVGGLLPASVLAATADYAPRPDLVGTTNGIVMQGSNLGQLMGPPAVAALVAATGSWQASAVYVTGMGIAGIGLGLVIRRLRDRGHAT